MKFKHLNEYDTKTRCNLFFCNFTIYMVTDQSNMNYLSSHYE